MQDPVFPAKTRKDIFLVSLMLMLAAGCFLRVAQLGRFPLQLNQDELSNIYDGYAIAETGADRWGEQFPLILRGFGKSDYRPPLYAWLCAVTAKISVYSDITGRLPSAVLGSISLFLLFFLARKMGGILFALVALLFLVLSPWHLMYSRSASEGAMLPSFFLLLAGSCWVIAREKLYPYFWLLLTGLIVGLGTNAYQASKLVFLLFAVLVVADLLKQANQKIGRIFVFGLGCFVGALPQLLVLVLRPDQFFSRANGSMMPYTFTFEYFSELARNIVSNLAPDFLFFRFGEYNNLTIGRLLTVEVFFFYLGLFYLAKVLRKDQPFKPLHFYLILLIGILPSALTYENPHALRASGIVALLPLLSAAGVMFIYQNLKSPAWRNVFLGISTACIIANGLYFTDTYASSTELKSTDQQPFIVAAAKKVNELKLGFDKIFVERLGTQDYVYYVYYTGMKPREFQQAKKIVKQDVWDNVEQIDNFYFRLGSELADQKPEPGKKELYVMTSRRPDLVLVDSVVSGRWKILFYTGKQQLPLSK